MIEIPPLKPIRALSALVIDGQSLVHDTIKSALSAIGIHQCRSAENAYYALRLCEETKFDVILIAFDIRSDKDGFNLLEEMKLKGYITKSTIVIFLSADTSKELVNCVVELQPNDFWVKPLDLKKIEKRFTYLFEIRQQLHRLLYCVEKGEYPTAIYYAERKLDDPKLSQYHPFIHRLIGECFFSLMEYPQAEALFRRLDREYSYGWVRVSLVRSLLKQNKIAEAHDLANELLKREDTRFTTYDALAEYYIANEDYSKGYEIIQEATKLAPRNLDRNKKSWNLARLNHDKRGQYIATVNMAKYAKNSIHDSPDMPLNVLRSAIDLAGSLNGDEAKKLILKTERDVANFAIEYRKDKRLTNQLAVIQARVCNLKQDKKAAEEILQSHMETSEHASIEDSLDKVKAFHEMGYWEDSIALLNTVKAKIEGDSFLSQVINEYIEQETSERSNILYSAKELAEMAAAHYKSKRYKPAYDLLTQAFTIAPRNTNIALSMLKVLAKLHVHEKLDMQKTGEVNRCKTLLESTTLAATQQKNLAGYLTLLEPQMVKANTAT